MRGTSTWARTDLYSLRVTIRYNGKMEREAQSTSRKFTDVLKEEFPEASQVLVSFPDKWEFIDTVQREHDSIYLAGFPIERAFNGREHFEGLGPEVNVNLVFYRFYKFFQPWPMPKVTVEWHTSHRHGRVTDVAGWKVQMQPIGQAQAWFGVTHGLVWECYFEESGRFGNWQETLARVWQRVENDINTPRIFTAPHDPAFPRGYRDFLTRLGYSRDAEYPAWWSKSVEPVPTRILTTQTAN